MLPLAVAILNVLFAAPPHITGNETSTSCQYIHNLNGTCEIFINCQFYLSSNSTDHLTHFPVEVSTCSKGYICCPHNNIKLLPTPPTCGFDLENHISNGDETNFYNFRFVILLQYELKSSKQTRNFLCGGSLINDQYILSAAHCVKSPAIINEWDLVSVRLGEWNLNEDPDCIYVSTCADKFVERGISEVKIHQNYRIQNKYIMDDIMLIRLDKPIDYTEFIKPLCLPIFGMPDYSDLFQIVGWGRKEFNGPLSAYKQSGLVKMVNPWTCAITMGLNTNDFNNSLICTTEFLYDGKTTSPCFGDSGGPLLQSAITNHRSIPYQYLAGIISTGDKLCNSSVTPTLHANVIYYINWIIVNIRS